MTPLSFYEYVRKSKPMLVDTLKLEVDILTPHPTRATFVVVARSHRQVRTTETLEINSGPMFAMDLL